MAPPLTALLGRTRELQSLTELLAQGTRLCTLTGPGGIGKTRLALALAQTLDGTFCDLSECTDLDTFYLRIDSTLRTHKPDASRPSIDLNELSQTLASHTPTLLVLDNLEQLVHLIGPPIAHWLAHVPALQILATSREALALDGEHITTLTPLSLDDHSEEQESSAVQLFVQRITATGFALSVDAMPQVRALVRVFEGVPLALELAAASARRVGLTALCTAHEAHIDTLRNPRRDAPARHQSLRAAIDGSWALLSTQQQQAFASCSVFRGGFDLAAARAVLAPDPLSADLALQALLDRSLVQTHTDALGRPRFALLDTLRTYASQQLASDPALAPQAQHRHTQHFLAQGTTLARALEENPRPEDAETLALERDNLSEIAARSAHPDTTARALLALDPVVRRHGPLKPHRDALARALTRAPNEPALHARLLQAHAHTARVLGAPETAQADLSLAWTLALQCNHPALEASVLLDQALLAHQLREVNLAQNHYLAARSRSADRPHWLARIDANLAALAHDRADYTEAEQRYRDALTHTPTHQDPRLDATLRSNLALLLFERDRLDEAHALFDQALLQLDQSTDTRLHAIHRSNRAVLLHHRGLTSLAQTEHQEAIAQLAHLGDTHSEALARARLAAVLIDRALLDQARDELSRSALLLAQSPDPASALTLALTRAALDLALCQDTPEALRNAVQRAEKTLAECSSPGSLGGLSDDVRAAARWLSRRLATLALTPNPATSPGPPVAAQHPTLTVARDQRWFRLTGEPTQDLSAHNTLRRMLFALVDTLTSPANSLTLDELIARTWPNERVLALSAHNRAHVLLSSLRRRGLRPWLTHHEGRYALSPALTLAWSDEPAPPPPPPPTRGRPKRNRQ
ncbi:MAG: hypothetical protein Q8Q09_01725 [Deltaproteobacteria bacterium]|nr:hypothetical protein [Deltaproteobacteria bacterium]